MSAGSRSASVDNDFKLVPQRRLKPLLLKRLTTSSAASSVKGSGGFGASGPSGCLISASDNDGRCYAFPVTHTVELNHKHVLFIRCTTDGAVERGALPTRSLVSLSISKSAHSNAAGTLAKARTSRSHVAEAKLIGRGMSASSLDHLWHQKEALIAIAHIMAAFA